MPYESNELTVHVYKTDLENYLSVQKKFKEKTVKKDRSGLEI